MAAEDVNVSVDEDHLDHFDDVVRAIEKAGMKVQRRLALTGVVSGSIDTARLPDLEQVPGVAAVERSRVVRIPPPESELQ